jgi:hypothetical protein
MPDASVAVRTASQNKRESRSCVERGREEKSTVSSVVPSFLLTATPLPLLSTTVPALADDRAVGTGGHHQLKW